MGAILGVTVPFFALVLCGWLGAQSRVLPQSAIPGLNAFVLYFALPCMLFRFGAAMPFAQLVDPLLVGLYAACALAMVGLTIAFTLRRGRHPGVGLKDAAFGALVAAFPNSGFMGVPLLVALLGESAAGPVIGTMLVDFTLTSTLCIALAQLEPGAAGDAKLGAALARAGRGALVNPLPWAIVAGAAFGASGLALPAALAQIVRMLADAATPVALFTIGAVLWRARQHAHTRTPASRFVAVALLKVALHPALVLGAGLALGAAGVEVPAAGLTALALTAALPSASNASLLAERFEADNGRIAAIILASTVIAFASFSAIAWLLGAGAAK